MVGAEIGNYRLVRKLGEGGMGAVYLAEHKLLPRHVAVKLLLPALSAQPEIVERFFNEARAVTSINDPGIVQVFDFGYHADAAAYLMMEYLEGEALDRRLARLGRLPVADALRLCRQVATSLAAAHARQIVHRDLKPENIFLVHDAEVAGGERTKILDFGVAKLSEEHAGKVKTNLGALMGTPTYMSPEQCRGIAGIDHRSDIYSLGCVLFHLITGAPPFDGEGTGDIISAHIREPAPRPSSRVADLAADVDHFVARCLAKAPAERFQTMVAVTAELGALLAAPATPAMPAHLRATTRALVLPRPCDETTAHERISVEELQRIAGPDDATRPLPQLRRIKATTLGASTGQITQLRRRLRWPYRKLVIGGAAAIAVAVAALLSVTGDLPVQAPPSLALQAAQPPPSAPLGRMVTPTMPASIAPAQAPAVEAAAPPPVTPPRIAPARKRPAPVRAAAPPAAAPVRAIPPAPAPARPRCERAMFWSIYTAASPTPDELRAGLRALRACHDAGEISDTDFDDLQAALVARL